MRIQVQGLTIYGQKAIQRKAKPLDVRSDLVEGLTISFPDPATKAVFVHLDLAGLAVLFGLKPLAARHSFQPVTRTPRFRVSLHFKQPCPEPVEAPGFVFDLYVNHDSLVGLACPDCGEDYRADAMDELDPSFSLPPLFRARLLEQLGYKEALLSEVLVDEFADVFPAILSLAAKSFYLGVAQSRSSSS